MKGKRLWIVWLLLLATGCAVSLPPGERGVVAMVPFWDEQNGIHGVKPLDGWSEEATVLLQSFPGSREELSALLIEQTDLISIPQSRGTYQGAHMLWDLHTFHTQLHDGPPGIYRIDMGVSERDGIQYFAILVCVSTTYDQHETMYETVFEHVLYNLQPWQKEG
jgi:hypothetical protein